MVKAVLNDRELVTDILTHSFIDNKSVNYIVKQDKKKVKRIKSLMKYSFDICYLYGDVFLSDDRKGCALILRPDRKKTTLRSILLDLKLVVCVAGFSNIKRAISRESAISNVHPGKNIYYLWFIGVESSQQGQGVGSHLLGEIIQKGSSENRAICLETSTLKNIPWYERYGFRIYKELNFGYRLFCMKWER
ncbi:MAG: GNAT family N-acetyltransferase [Bacteroidetes bacterium]|nr:GNAT family N-acetyltransferase [Bacteroidota bacterium]